jgi:hypothetical protein
MVMIALTASEITDMHSVASIHTHTQRNSPSIWQKQEHLDGQKTRWYMCRNAHSSINKEANTQAYVLMDSKHRVVRSEIHKDMYMRETRTVMNNGMHRGRCAERKDTDAKMDAHRAPENIFMMTGTEA